MSVCLPVFPLCRIHAVLDNKIEAVDALLQAGADVLAATPSGDTPLHWAAYKVRYHNLMGMGLPCSLSLELCQSHEPRNLQGQQKDSPQAQ